MSWKIVWPAPFAPVPSVPSEAYVSPPRVKKSRSVCGLPVVKLATNSQSAFGPPDCASGSASGDAEKAGASWSSSLSPWPAWAVVGSTNAAQSTAVAAANFPLIETASRLYPVAGVPRAGNGQTREPFAQNGWVGSGRPARSRTTPYSSATFAGLAAATSRASPTSALRS